MTTANKYGKYALTGTVVLIAVAAVLFKYGNYVTNPWTRDGQVRAQVIQITPRVSGPIVNLPITDNLIVKAGDLLFAIDPRTYQSALAQDEATVLQARAAIQAAQVQLDEAKVEEDRARRIRERQAGAISAEDLIARENTRRGAEASLAQARGVLAQSQAALDNARLNLEFTEVLAPADGYVTNLNLRVGSQAVTNSPALALVDTDSYWVHGFFRENYIRDIRPGDRAIVTLMTYHDRPLEGRVHSLGWGIAQSDGSTGQDLLPNISPTFEWIRLAQRVPVRIHLLNVPDDIDLRVGTTASVLVQTGTAAEEVAGKVPPAPGPLQ